MTRDPADSSLTRRKSSKGSRYYLDCVITEARTLGDEAALATNPKYGLSCQMSPMKVLFDSLKENMSKLVSCYRQEERSAQ